MARRWRLASSPFIFSIGLELGLLVAVCGGGGQPQKVLVSIQISPNNPSVAVGTNQQFTAVGQFNDGSTEALAPPIVWSSSNTGVVSVNSAGTATALTIGRVQITASSGSVMGSTVLISVIGNSVEVPSYAYVTNNTDRTVSAFIVDPTSGALTPIGGGAIAAGADPLGVTSDPLGRFVFVANGPSNAISSFSVDASTGALSPIVGSPFAGVDPMVADPSGQFLYVSSQNGSVFAYRIDQMSGSLHPIGSPSPEVTVERSVVHPSGKFLYCITAPVITVLVIDPETGALTAAGQVGPGPGTEPVVGQAIDPLGRFLYATGRVDLPPFRIEESSIDPVSGGLTTISGSPVTLPNRINGMAIDPKGKFAYVSTSFPEGIAVFSINSSTGALNLITSSPVPTPNGPLSITVDPSGRFIYGVYQSLNSIGWLTIDPNTGIPTPTGSAPTGTMPVSVTVVGKAH